MDKKREVVPTGIPGFDQMIDGGFIPQSVNLLVGGAGAGKSIFAAMYIAHGIMKYNEPGIYITFEDKKDKFYKDIESFGYDLAALEKTGKFVFLEYTPEQVRNVLIEGGGIIESIIEKIKAKRLVIDSITSFALLYEDELARKEAALALFDLINRWGCTALLTSENESGREDVVEVELGFEADSVILSYHPKIEGERIRALEVVKMRRAKHKEKTVAMEITGKGIVVHPDKIIKKLS
ncbi:MAG: ATPase domain-containing protein [Candidatus Woesearchaeota archaeon]